MKEAFEALQSELESCASEEREYHDNMPEGLQNSDKGTQADEAASALEECDDECNTILGALDELIEKINKAIE